MPICLLDIHWYTTKVPRIVNTLSKLLPMDTVNVLFVCIAIVAASTKCCGQESTKCGPMEKCNCFWYSRTPENITMDCSGQGFISLGEICETVGNATRLIVNSNRINGTLVDDSRIDGCQELVYLSLRNNTITELEQKTIERFKTLRTLDLSHNILTIYRSDTGYLFESLDDLEALALNGNRVKNSDNSQWYPDLSRNDKLLVLFIDGLPETDISTNAFPKLTNLTSLTMTGSDGNCEIRYISNKFFEHLPNLKTLSMSMCKLEVIEINAFSSLSHLNWLDLSLNIHLSLRGLHNISYSLQFTNIKFMNYSFVQYVFGLGQELRKRDICFLRNTTIRELVLDGNNIELVETNAAQLFPPTLQVLHMNKNMFTFGPYLLQLGCGSNDTEFYGSFQNMAHNPMRYRKQETKYEQTPVFEYCPFLEDHYLRNVSDLTENCIFFEHNDTITIYPTFPKSVKKLLFNDCNMKYKLTSLFIIPIQNNFEYIDASGNVLFAWDGPIGPFPKLKYLDLSRNYCSKIDRKFFEYMKWLENLQIHSNFIGLSLSNTSDKDVFHDLVSLKTLNLSMNKITSLHPKSFEGLLNLETLDLSLNKIDKWLFEVETMFNLTNVNLRSNALQSLPSHFTRHLEKTAQRRGTSFSIDLRNNPLRYGCQTRKFLRWMIDHKSSFVHFEEYIFIDDDGQQIYDIEENVMDLGKRCQSYTVWIVISVIGVSVALSIIIGGIVYRNRWKLRYFIYMSKQRFYGYVKIPNENPVENYKFDAFISYAEENIRFVRDYVIPNIETDGVLLCIHQRDFLAGNAIADNIIDAIKSSRKTVVLLTKAFLKRKWCVYELNMARMENIYSRDGRGCLVIVMLEPVPTKDMPIELIEYIRTESYLEYTTDNDGEQLFWNNFRDAINQR